MKIELTIAERDALRAEFVRVVNAVKAAPAFDDPDCGLLVVYGLFDPEVEEFDRKAGEFGYWVFFDNYATFIGADCRAALQWIKENGDN